MTNQLFLLSPEHALQCCGIIKPNTTYEVRNLREYTDGRTFVDFIVPGFKFQFGLCCENLTEPCHLRLGGRWLLLEQLP